LGDLDTKLNFNNMPGNHTVLSPVVGSRAGELQHVKETLGWAGVLQQFEQEIYMPERVFLIPEQQRTQADMVAERQFRAYLDKYKNSGVTQDNAVGTLKLGNMCFRPGFYSIQDLRNSSNTWRVEAVVETDDQCLVRNGGYVPAAIAKIHELMHVEEIPKNAPRSFQNETGNEILTALKTLLLEDETYKEINRMPLDQIVDYKQSLHIGGRDIPLGKVANFYRQLEAKYKTLGAAVTSPESLVFLSGSTAGAVRPGQQRPPIEEAPPRNSADKTRRQPRAPARRIY
jgi:hypothetical protein